MATAIAITVPTTQPVISSSTQDPVEQLSLDTREFRIEYADAQRTTEVREALFAGPHGEHTIIEVSLETLQCAAPVDIQDDVDLKIHWFAARRGCEPETGDASFLLPVGALDAFGELIARLVRRARATGDIPEARSVQPPHRGASSLPVS